PIDGTPSVVTLNKSNGEVLSTFEGENIASVADFGGDVIIGASDEDGDDATIARFGVNDLDGDPKWEADVDSILYASVLDNFVVVTGSDEGEVFNANDGSKAKWGS